MAIWARIRRRSAALRAAAARTFLRPPVVTLYPRADRDDHAAPRPADG